MPIRVLVVGLGGMGRAHALACQADPGFALVGVVDPAPVEVPAALLACPRFSRFDEALAAQRPDAVVIATYTETHAAYAIAAMEAGADVFCEKPLAPTLAEATRVVRTARRLGRKLVVGYILRHHPSWRRFIAEARALGPPYVMRMNLNQQSAGPTWETHKRLMASCSPIVDCGVHYLDVMCQITDAPALEVRGMGVRLTDEIATDMYNYGHLQVLFADGSVGWYEAGWGPMMSREAFFVKDVIGPRGSVSIVVDPAAAPDDHETHTKTSRLLVHRAERQANGSFAAPDRIIAMTDEPGHQALCDREQAFFRAAIEADADLAAHEEAALRSLAICLAADESVRTGQPIRLGPTGA